MNTYEIIVVVSYTLKNKFFSQAIYSFLFFFSGAFWRGAEVREQKPVINRLPVQIPWSIWMWVGMVKRPHLLPPSSAPLWLTFWSVSIPHVKLKARGPNVACHDVFCGPWQLQRQNNVLKYAALPTNYMSWCISISQAETSFLKK